MALKTTTDKKKESQNFINLGIVLNDREEVLIIKRAKEETGAGVTLTYAFPGGKQHLDESRAECVAREILAETGYAVISKREISLRKHPQFDVFIVYHECELIEDKPIDKPSEPHEVAEVLWRPVDKLRSLFTTDLDPAVATYLGVEELNML